MFVDLTADVSRSLNMGNASELEEKITLTLQNARKEISDVRVKFHPVEDDRPSEPK
jgi:divalent metal cation (Fe/Co/Zn/Cd) transporter